jgi:hypothetical protein
VVDAFDLAGISNTVGALSFVYFAKGGNAERSHQKETDLVSAASPPTVAVETGKHGKSWATAPP